MAMTAVMATVMAGGEGEGEGSEGGAVMVDVACCVWSWMDLLDDIAPLGGG